MATVNAMRRFSSVTSHHARNHARLLSTSPRLQSGLCFALSDQQKEYQDLARKFAVEQIIPNAAKLDESGEYPHDLFKQAWDLGLLNLGVPTDIGGPGLGLVDSCVILEEIAYGCTGVSTALYDNGLASAPIILGASKELQKKFLGRLIESPIKAAYCVTEPNAGSDVAGIRTKAEKKGDEYVLNGQKMWITNANVASWYFVLARTDPKGKPGSAFTGFVVDGDTPGIVRGKKLKNLGQRCSDTAPLTFEDVVVPKENVVGAEGAGFKIAMGAFDAIRPLTAIGGVGIIKRSLHESLKYALERKTMGQPIAEHQMIQSMLADMAISLEATRLLVMQAAWIGDQGKRNTFEASLSKAYGGPAGVMAALDAVQIFGGAGYNTEYPVEKLLRDSKIIEIYEGTTQIQKLIIARELIGRAKSGQLQ